MFKYRQLFFLPSFYLFVTFSTAYLFYLTDIIKWERPPIELHFWSLITILSSLLSVFIYSKKYNKIINSETFKAHITTPFLINNKRTFLLVAIAVIGILGIVKYVLDYSRYLGAFGVFTSIFIEDTGQLRTLSENVDSIGTQISYFSWLVTFILTIEIGVGRIHKSWLSIIILIIILNSIFLDRTRPVWIIFTCILLYFFVTYNKISRKKIIYSITGVALFFISIFVGIGAALGKGSGDKSYTKFELPTEIQPIFLYLTSSFAYLGRLIANDNPCDYFPVRIGYPVDKILAKAHLVESPPSPILDFFSVPLLTNVGTFLEPFFQDGGRLFMLIAIVLHTFIFDWLVLRLMKKISPLNFIAIASVCFVNFIAFFVPRFPSTAIWFILLFCFLYPKIESRLK